MRKMSDDKTNAANGDERRHDDIPSGKPVMLPGTIATRNAPPFAGYSPTPSPYMTPTGDPNIDAHRFLDTMSAMRRFKRLIDEARGKNAQDDDKKGEESDE